MGQKKIKYWYKEIPQELKSLLGSSKFKISLSKLEKKEHRYADRILTLAAKEIFVNINLFEDVEITCTKDERDDKKFMTKKVVEALKEKTLNITAFDFEIDDVDEA